MIEFLAQEQQSSPLSFLIFLVPIALLFFMMRSQKRKLAQQQELQRAAAVGDDVLTTSGIFGTIVDEDEDEGTVEVEIAPGTRVTMLRSGIARNLSGDEEYEDEPEEPAGSTDDDRGAQGPIGS